MTDKTIVLITGGNQGLGYYAAQQMAASGRYHVLLGSRDMSKAHKAIQAIAADTSYKVSASDLEPIQIDVTSDESIQAAAKQVEQKHGKLDILMNNAGISRPQAQTGDSSGPSLRQHYHQLYDTNVFGAAVVADTFLPLLRKSTAPNGKRIAFTSSGLSSLTWARAKAVNGLYRAKNYPVYRSTKTALSMITLHYADLLEDEGFVVGASDPGYCATNLNEYNGLKDPREGAKVLIRVATDTKEKVHGYVVDENEPEPW